MLFCDSRSQKSIPHGNLGKGHKVEAPLLAASIQPFIEDSPYNPIELTQALRVASDSIIVVVSSKFRVQLSEKRSHRERPMSTTPFLEVLHTLSKPLTRGSYLYDRLAFPAQAPSELKTEEVKTLSFLYLVSAEPYDSGLFLGKCESEFLEPSV